ncbi:hypothetical protein ACFPN1_09900 [Lysobacter yangpyeongensis]|uniref:DUF4156 domain-containing protein n=1 Tax=Lysobacter yangpyeongensis TaxID=346182 RepID=A0ABW0SN26_9GAMM
MRTLIAVLMLTLAACASTHHVMLGQARPAIDPAQVKVYQVPPKHYEEIARLDAKSGVGFGTQGQINSAIDRLAREAAKLGANGVILLGVDQTGSPVSLGVGGGSFGRHGGASVGMGIPTAQQRAEGIAIYVTEE